MIKNWKMFLESIYDDENELENLKNDMLKSFSVFLDTASKERPKMTQKEIEDIADMVVDMLGRSFLNLIKEREDWPKEVRDKFGEFFLQSLLKSKQTMIDKSFKDGFLQIIDEFVTLVNGFLKEEGEDWKKEKSREYEYLSKSEIQELIDIALDNRDFDEVRRLSQYLESYKYLNIEYEIQKVVTYFMKIVDLIIA